MRWNILIGGEAGQGPNLLADLVSKGLIDKGFKIFNSRDYQSLIRGGHNFNLISFSDKPISSNHEGIDILIPLDNKTTKIHKPELNKKSIVLQSTKSNIFYAGAVYKILNLDFKILKKALEKLRNYNENIREAIQGFNSTKDTIKLPKLKKQNLILMDGSEAVAEGAIRSGLDVYFAYPMTPATGVLTHLAQRQLKNKHLTVELENEIAVANAAAGSAVTGAKTMLGSSGGGFDLMTESLSMYGVAEIPIVLYLCQRPGPGTGVATYTSQGDLNMALNSGHGEFSRIVLTPGDAKEAISLTTEAFYFSQKYRVPVIILSDKQLAESKYTFFNNPKLTKSQKSIKHIEKFHSYEHNSLGVSIEDSRSVIKSVEKRLAKQQAINKEAAKFQQYRVYGKTNSKNVVVSWGSTKGAILNAIDEANLNCKHIHLKYVEPFPNILKEIKNKNIIVIENNAMSPLSNLIRQKTGIEVKNKILRYDGRPFTSTEIETKLKKVLR